MTIKDILLKKLNSILNTPLEKKITQGLFFTGMSLITIPILYKLINFKYISDSSTIELNNGGGNHYLSLIIGLILVVTSIYLLFYFKNKEKNVATLNETVTRKIPQKLLLQYTTMIKREKFLDSYQSNLDILNLVSKYINSNNLPISVEIEFNNERIILYSSSKTTIKLVFLADLVLTSDFDKLITGEISLLEFINIINNTNILLEDFDKLDFSWEKYLKRYGFNWTNIIPREEPLAKSILNEKSVLWVYGNTCTGKTYLGLQLYKNNNNPIVFNSTYGGSISVDMTLLLLRHGSNCSLLLDDLQTNYKLSRKVLNEIEQYKKSYVIKKVEIILISWKDLYYDLSLNYDIDSISVDSSQFLFYLKNKIPSKRVSEVLDVTKSNIAILDVARKLLKSKTIDNKDLKGEIFKYFVPFDTHDDLLKVYICSVLGTFDFEIDIEFLKKITNSKTIFNSNKMPTLKTDDNHIFLGHRAISSFIYDYLKETTSFHNQFPRDEVIIKYLESIDAKKLWTALTQIIGTETNKDIGSYTPLWKLMINFKEAITEQAKYNVSWDNTPSSMYFAIKTLSLLGLVDEYEKTLDEFLNNFKIINNNIIISFDKLQTTYDFIKIKERMENEDTFLENNSYEKGIDINPEEMHKNWLFGLYIGLSKEIKESSEDKLSNLVLKDIINSQKDDGSWYPSRVPWVTSRILIGLGESHNKDAVFIEKSISYLLTQLKDGYCEAHTGGWNNIYETTALCLEALTEIGFNCKENEITNQALKFLLDNKKRWMNEKNELDGTATACLLIKNFGINQDLFNYIEELSSRNLSSLISNDINFNIEQSCKSAQIGYYIIDLSWFILRQDLSGLLEAFLKRSNT